jgi:hypothetical protein
MGKSHRVQVSYAEGVRKKQDADLNGILVGEEVDDFESVCDDADGHKLLAIVATLHHKTAGCIAKTRLFAH